MTPVVALSTDRWMWYVARGSGIVSLVLLTGSVLLGIVTSMRWMSDRWPRFATTMLHRNLSLLAVVFLAVHVVTIVVDGFAPIRWLDVVVPFASPYRTIWLGLGTIAFDLVLALVVTSLLRNRIGPRLWRGVHWLAYACWPVAVVHGLGTGTDASTTVVLAIDAACVAAVVVAAWWRLTAVRPGPARRWSLTAVAVLPLLLIAWLQDGPLAPEWAARAGTPAALLGGGVTSVASAAAARDAVLGPAFAGAFDGTVTRTAAGGNAVVLQVEAPLPEGTLRVVLEGDDNGTGLVVRRGSASVSAGNVTEFEGTLTRIQDRTLVVAPSKSSPTQRSLAIDISRLDEVSRTVSGSVRALANGRTGDDG
jgi:hypothetical protein